MKVYLVILNYLTMKCVVNKMKSEIVNKGLKLIEDASLILESISNKPGVTCYQFFEALDIAEIWCEDRRDALYLAATTIESSMETLNDSSNLTIH